MVGNFKINVLYICMTTINDIELLFRKHFKNLLIFANRIVADEEVALDIVHDVFASLLTNCPDSISSAFLYNATRFACLNHIRSLSIRERFNKLYAIEIEEAEEFQWKDNDDASLLNSIIDHDLSEQCRRVLRLRFTERLTYKEISEKLSISEAAVYKHLRHAINVLRQKFNNHER